MTNSSRAVGTFTCIDPSAGAIVGYRFEKKQDATSGKTEVRWYYAGAVNIAFVEIYDAKARNDFFVVHIVSDPAKDGRGFESVEEGEEFIKMELIRKL